MPDIDKAKDPEINRIIRQVTDNTLGNIQILNSVPAKDDLKANTIAHHNNVIYIRLVTGELKKFTVTDVP